MQLSPEEALPEHLNRCLSRWFGVYRAEASPGAPLLVAVSGGSDSLALLVSLANFRETLPGPLHAVTVDHALRPEAAEEAERVAIIAGNLGIPHSTLRLSWPAGESVSQARARKARYEAISHLARKIDARIILTGHTLDDQLETVFMRLGAGSDSWGLAGMADIAPLPVWPEGADLKLGRPFVSQRRDSLRAYLRALDLLWVDDPSNKSLRYERVRVRHILANRSAMAETLLQIVLTSSQLRQLQCDRLSRWVNTYIEWLPGGAARMSSEAIGQLSPDDRSRLLQTLLMCISGASTPVQLTRISEVMENRAQAKGLTLGGCFVEGSGDDLLIASEVDKSTQETDISRDSVIWSGRSCLSGPDETLRSCNWVPWGERSVPSRLRNKPLPPFAVRRSLPVGLSSDGEVTLVPHLDENCGIRAKDLGTMRLFRLFRHQTEVFEHETRLGESFSPPSSTMLGENL